MKVRWDGPQFRRKLTARLGSNLGDAGALLVSEIQANIGIQGPPPSRPGEFPHRDTGELQASFHFQVDTANLGVRVMTDVSYSVELELGTGRVEARPFLARTLILQADAVAREVLK
jgi:hypothetical protein